MNQPHPQDVYFYYSTEAYLLAQQASKTIAALSKDTDAELATFEGPNYDMDELVTAAGTISMFGTKRILFLPQLDLTALREDDSATLCDVCQSLENAVVVITSVFTPEKVRDGGKRMTKKEKAFLAHMQSLGTVTELRKPQLNEVKQHAVKVANALDTALSPQVAQTLVDRCGTDYFALESEIAKLAAASGYTEITHEIVGTLGTVHIDADVFEMARLVSSRQLAKALAKLKQLLDLRHEPIAISAALASSFVDMYRVKVGAAQRQSYTAVHKAFGYKGSDYRLKKASEAARNYSPQQLCTILRILETLDAKMKSSATASEVLLQTALCEIASLGGRA